MRYQNRKRHIYITIIFVLSISMGIGYAYLNSTLNINGTTKIAKNTWDIHFENLVLSAGNVVAGTPATIKGNSTLIDFSVTLSKPGDYYEFMVDVKNAGTIDAMVSSVLKNGLTTEQAKFVDFNVSYSDSDAIVEKNILPANTKDTVMVKIKYKNDVGNLPSTDQFLNLTLQMTYVQADVDAFSRYNTFEKLFARRTVLDNKKSEFVSSSSGIDFSRSGSITNGKGIYTRAGTETNLHPVYYYRGESAINHVKFAGFCWRIVRTTETGGTKLIYNGVPGSDGSCNNTGEATGIGSSMFNDQDKPSVGYMYGKSYPHTVMQMSASTSYYFGRSASYSDGGYNLGNAFLASNLSSVSKGDYVCFTSRLPFCNPIYYISYADRNTNSFRAIPLLNGETINGVFGDITTKSANTTNSTIKTTTDTWYQQNMTSYTAKLEDTVWCNDRSTSSTISDDPIWFTDYSGLIPRVLCPSSNDKFTIDSRNGNGKLTYPVGMLTADEFLMGNNYLAVGVNWWTMTPSYYDNRYSYSYVIYVEDNYLTNIRPTHNTISVRPSISLKPGTIPSGGAGTATNPYIVK